MASPRQDAIHEEGWLLDLAEQGRPLADTSRHWRHDAINLSSLALVLAAFPLLWLALRPLPLALTLPLLGVAYGTLIFSLFTLVVHEASHITNALWRRTIRRTAPGTCSPGARFGES